MPNFPGCSCRIPSIDPMLVKRDVTNNGHDWGEFEPIIYQEKDSWYMPPRAGHYTCKKCGMKAFSLCVQDFDTIKIERGQKIRYGGRPPIGVELEPKPEKYIMTWDIGNELEDSLYQLSCDELLRDKLWIATIDDEERLEQVAHFKERCEERDEDDSYFSTFKELYEKYESLVYADEFYKSGAYKVNFAGDRVTFVANLIAVSKIRGIVGVRVEER